jgi:hypothetical protein
MSGRTPQHAYLNLQNLARAQGRNTQQLFELYIHERFLARLAESRFSEMLVLKGGDAARRAGGSTPHARRGHARTRTG